MDYKVLILSHGKFCEEIINSAEMITGKNDKLEAVPLLVEDDPGSFCGKLKEKIESLNGKPFIIICDVLGGTPFNCALSLLKEYDFSVVTGLCLGMLLELAFLQADSVDEVANKMIEISQNSGHKFNNDFI